MSYYDVDTILADAQKVPCIFQLDVPGLGYLDGNPGGTVKAGTKIDLPLWLAVTLAVSGGANNGADPLITLDFPPALQQRVTNALKADARSVDLRAQAPHFYALGALVLELFEDDDLVNVLVESFRSRASKIADHGHNTQGALSDGADFMRGLDESERQLFRSAHEGPRSVKAWLQNLKKA